MQSTQPANPYGFDDLTPIAEASKENVFIKALNWALLNKKIKNIAVTGPYGSGKSSMLEAFITVSPEHKYLKISLASFRGGEEEEGGEEPNAQKKNEAHRLLELSILQQIFYKVKDSDLPDSRFKRIRNLTVGKMALLVGLLLLTLISVLALIFRSYFENISFFCGFSASHPDLVILLPFSTLLPGFVWLVVSLQRFFNRSGFKKLNISSGEIEINPKSETSILNKYLDEIVYFFEVNFYDIAIIEDLDRFNDPEIFTKLRELNQLLNNSSQLNRHIVFIYAIRDDIFPDQRARTKFFDFILPVIPVINWSNSLQKLWDKLNEPAYGLVINERFVTAITLYIDDMRVLKNIFNELMLYKESLGVAKSRHTKLLAMIVYKNIYPKDFALLHENKGIVYRFFASKEQWKLDAIGLKMNAVKKMQEDISRTQNALQADVTELRAIYIQTIIDALEEWSYFTIDGARVTFAELYRDNNFNKLISKEKLKYYKISHGNLAPVYDFKKIEAVVSQEYTYQQRENLILNKSNGKIGEWNRQIAKIQKEIDDINASKLAALLQEPARILQPFTQEDLKIEDHNLLVYLLREGFIDETYTGLISYFYPGSIGRNEKDFIENLNDLGQLDFDFELEKIEGLIQKIEPYEFERPAILNTPLVTFLLDPETKYWDKLNRLMRQLSDHSPRSLQFIEHYMVKGTRVPEFTSALCRAWPEIWQYIDAEFPVEKKERYLKLILQYTDADKISTLDAQQLFSTYLGSRSDFLTLIPMSNNLHRLERIIEALQIKFEKLDWHESAVELFNFIADNDYYAINPFMLQQVLQHYNSGAYYDADQFRTQNLTLIRNSGYEHLINYVDENLETYLNEVFFIISENVSESEKTLVYLMNHEQASDLATQIIDKGNTVLSELISVTNTAYWSDLFEFDVVKPAWNNVIEYFIVSEGINDILVEYLGWQDNAMQLAKNKLKPQGNYLADQVKALSQALVLCNDLANEAYAMLLDAIIYSYPALDFADLSEEKLELLIKKRKIELTIENYTLLISDFPDQTINLLSTNPGNFLKQPEDYPTDADGYTAILQAPATTEQQQLEIINLLDAEIFKDPTLATEVNKILATEDDFGLEDAALLNLLKFGGNINDNLQLLIPRILNLEPALVRDALLALGGDYARIAGRQRPKFPSTPVNRQLAEALLDKKFISSYSGDGAKRKITINTKQT